jgi:hypothetical protein
MVLAHLDSLHGDDLCARSMQLTDLRAGLLLRGPGACFWDCTCPESKSEARSPYVGTGSAPCQELQNVFTRRSH